MIGTALRFPIDATVGRKHFFAVTGALLTTAISARFALELYPLALSILAVVACGVAALVAVGICVEAMLHPMESPPTIGSLLRTGALAAGISVVVMAVPVGILVWTVFSYGAEGAAVDGSVGTFFLLGSTTALVTFLAATYVLPVFVARTVRSGVRSISDGRPIAGVLREPTYLQGWSIGIVLAIMGWWAAVVGVTSNTLVGFFAILVATYCLLAAMRAIGEGYAAVPGVEDYGST